jgi:hypothetical protein
MSHRPWFRRVALLTAGLFGLTCASTQEVSHPSLYREFADGPENVVSVTTTDGVKHPFDGRGSVHGDELVLHRRNASDRGTSSTQIDSSAYEIRVPLEQVTLVEVQHETRAPPPGEKPASGERDLTGLWIALGVLAAIGILLLVIALSKSSCPFIYSHDGEKYVFDGEPYGGAVFRSLARTDWSELSHLREVDGRYRLLLTNEVDETQHTDSLALMVVDHDPDELAVMDYQGKPHLLKRVTAPVSAHDEAGHDLLPFLKATDGVSWTPELISVTRRLPLADVRNHITVEFGRPPGATRVWLLANVATGPWGGTQLRTMLGMHGTAIDQWTAAVDGSPEIQRQLREWNEREELFHLGVEVQVGDRWERRTMLLAGGPFRSETRAVVLDLTGVQGETIRIRMNPPIGFWRFESFQLAWEERPGTAAVLLPRSAIDEHGKDVRPLLLKDDGANLDQPEIGAVTRLEFDAPPPRAGGARTVFARTRGWYEVHLHDLGAPETENLARLAYEPGYAVRRSLDDLVEFRRTGRIPYTAHPAETRAAASEPGR